MIPRFGLLLFLVICCFPCNLCNNCFSCKGSLFRLLAYSFSIRPFCPFWSRFCHDGRQCTRMGRTINSAITGWKDVKIWKCWVVGNRITFLVTLKSQFLLPGFSCSLKACLSYTDDLVLLSYANEASFPVQMDNKRGEFITCATFSISFEKDGIAVKVKVDNLYFSYIRLIDAKYKSRIV